MFNISEYQYGTGTSMALPRTYTSRCHYPCSLEYTCTRTQLLEDRLTRVRSDTLVKGKARYMYCGVKSPQDRPPDLTSCYPQDGGPLEDRYWRSVLQCWSSVLGWTYPRTASTHPYLLQYYCMKMVVTCCSDSVVLAFQLQKSKEILKVSSED